MDKPLSYYLDIANDMYNNIVNYNSDYIDVEILQAYMVSIKTMIKQIQSVSKRMADISNIVGMFIKAKDPKAEIDLIDPYPEYDDWTKIYNKYSTKKKQLTKDIGVRVKIVHRPEDIPNHPLYYIEPLNQFAISVNGIILRGNIGNVVPPDSSYLHKCRYGNNCNDIVNCRYFHDPYQIFRMKEIRRNLQRNMKYAQITETAETAEVTDNVDIVDSSMSVHVENEHKTNNTKSTPVALSDIDIGSLKNIQPNFTQASFMYTPKINKKTNSMLHIGSKDTLYDDIHRVLLNQVAPQELDVRNYQIMHNLLIYLALWQTQTDNE